MHRTPNICGICGIFKGILFVSASFHLKGPGQQTNNMPHAKNACSWARQALFQTKPSPNADHQNPVRSIPSAQTRLRHPPISSRLFGVEQPCGRTSGIADLAWSPMVDLWNPFWRTCGEDRRNTGDQTTDHCLSNSR